MITYREVTEVYLDGKIAGRIEPHPEGFVYFPTGGRIGDVYRTVDEVKASLEAK